MLRSPRPPWLNHTAPLYPLPRAPPLIPRRILTTSTSRTAPIDLPKLAVNPSSPHHNSLPTYLAYTERTKLDPSTSIYIGTHYEYMCALSLRRLGFSLIRTGGKNDAGIDLVGHWALRPLREPMPVFVQCKALRYLAGPRNIRELEGSFQSVPQAWRGKDVLGLMVTSQKASRGVLETLGTSAWPMGFLKVTRAGTIEQFLWNRAASERGLEGVGVTIRHTPWTLFPEIRHQGEEDVGWTLEEARGSKHRRGLANIKYRNQGTKKDIQLTWMGAPIFPNPDEMDFKTWRLADVAVPEEVVPPVKKPRSRRPGSKNPKTSEMEAAGIVKIKRKVGRPRTREVIPPAMRKPPGRPFGAKDKTPRKRRGATNEAKGPLVKQVEVVKQNQQFESSSLDMTTTSTAPVVSAEKG